jgi:hypothetical protein
MYSITRMEIAHLEATLEINTYVFIFIHINIHQYV